MEIKELAIDRVDAVDVPATGRPFLLMKTADPAEVAKNAVDLGTAVAMALKALQEDAIELPMKSATALNGVSKLLNGADLFKPKATMPGADAAPDACPPGMKMGPDGKCMPAMPMVERKQAPTGDQSMTANPGVVTPATEQLTYAVKSAMAPMFEELTGAIKALTEQTGVKTSIAPKSKQVQDAEPVVKSGTKKFGEGLFSNVLFGQPAAR